jgi:hypothetical protein
MTGSAGREETVRRLVAFAGSAVALEWQGEDAAGIAALLFAAMGPAEEGGETPVASYWCGPGSAPWLLALRRNGAVLWEGEEPAVAAEAWLAAMLHDLASSSRGGLLFHAAALAGPRGALVLPGGSGVGKSTLTLWLATQGLGYRTDEMVFTPELTAEAVPCARPLCQTRGSREALAGVFDPGACAGELMEYHAGWIVPAAFLDPAASGDPLPWGLTVFPRYEAGAPLELEPVSKAQAAMLLMQCLVNARNLPEHGLPWIKRLAAAAPAYRLRYGSFAQLGPLLALAGVA